MCVYNYIYFEEGWNILTPPSLLKDWLHLKSVSASCRCCSVFS